MQVTDAQFRSYENGPMKAFVNVTFNNALVVKNFKVLLGKNGLFISFPQEKGKDGVYHDSVFPINKDVRNEIQRQVLDKYNTFVGGVPATETSKDDDLPF